MVDTNLLLCVCAIHTLGSTESGIYPRALLEFIVLFVDIERFVERILLVLCSFGSNTIGRAETANMLGVRGNIVVNDNNGTCSCITCYAVL